MQIVGLTGNVASGKSTVAELWRGWGVPVVSADQLARQAVEVGSTGLDEVVGAFGPSVLNPDGSMNRGAVRALVFEDDDARLTLESIIHPRVRVLRDSWSEARRDWGAPLIVWEVPLLFETGMDQEVDSIVLVDAPEAERVRRMTEHRGLTQPEAEGIMNAQGGAAEKRSAADIVINNGGSLDLLERQAREALQRLRQRLGPSS